MLFCCCFSSVLRVTSVSRVKLAGRKSALNTTVVYSTDRSTGPGVSVTLCCFVFFFLRGD